jgi:hypothetical protein
VTPRARPPQAGGPREVPSLATELEGLAGVRKPRGPHGAPAPRQRPGDAASIAVPSASDRSHAADEVASNAQRAAMHDGVTVATPDAAGAPGRPVEPLPPAGPRFRVVGGPERILTAPVLIGRRPMPPRVAGLAGPEPELVIVDSPQSVVSSTHLELRLEGTRLVATDLRSTNGTIVRSAAGVRRMRAGESLVVTPGSSIDLGDGTIIEILPAPGTSIE